VNRPLNTTLAQAVLSAVFVTLIALHTASVFRVAAIDRVESWFYDAWLKQTAQPGVDDRVTILDIDEKSLQEIGRWPWGRDKMVTLLDRLFDQYKVAAVGFDVVFAEPDTSSGLNTLTRLAQTEFADNQDFTATVARLKPQLDFDARFAKALAARPVTLGYYFIPSGMATIRTGVLPAPVLPRTAFGDVAPELAEPTGYGANLPQFQHAAQAAGFFNMQADDDGTARRMNMVMPFESGYHLSLSASTLRLAFGGDAPRAGSTPRHFLGRDYREPWIEVGGLKLPLNRDGTVYVPYRAGAPFPYVSAADVLKGRAKMGQLENRILLVGSTAPGLADLRVTPFSSTFPGVEIHAHLIAGMLDGNTRTMPAWADDARLLAVLLLGSLIAWVVIRFGPTIGLLASLAALLALTGAYALAWSHLWVIPMAAPLLTVLGLYLLNSAYGFFTASAARHQITKLFGQYVPPELAAEMSANPAHYSMAAQSREMSVLFSDIRGFTDFSEKLSPAELADVLNAYLNTMTHIVQKNRGTIDKYIGDAIMAFWNAPVDLADHAARAVQTALEMQDALPQLNEAFAKRGWPHVKIGVGVNTGRMSVGNMGSEFRMSYTVMGDAVNLGSRLEGITKQYGIGILVTEPTVRADPEHVFMKIDIVRVKGKETPVAIYQPLGKKGALPPEAQMISRIFEAAFERYQASDWEQAKTMLLELKAAVPCALCDVYLERIAHFQSNPPSNDWDGVFVYTTK
jgi:adenylate cyclase